MMEGSGSVPLTNGSGVAGQTQENAKIKAYSWSVFVDQNLNSPGFDLFRLTKKTGFGTVFLCSSKFKGWPTCSVANWPSSRPLTSSGAEYKSEPTDKSLARFFQLGPKRGQMLKTLCCLQFYLINALKK